MILELNQYAYILVLLSGTPVAFYSGSRFVALVMWLNLIFTLQYSHAPLVLQRLDLLCAVTIVMVTRDRAALTVSFIFGLMVFSYKLVEPLGFYATYSIVGGLAYVQIFAMGSTGFGTGIRIIRRRIRGLLSPPVHSKKTRMGAQGNAVLALGQDTRPRMIDLINDRLKANSNGG